MEFRTLVGLRPENFAAVVFMASDKRIADAVRDWCETHENTGKWIVDEPNDLIGLACLKAGIEIDADNINRIVIRVEVLAESRGVVLPQDWLVIY